MGELMTGIACGRALKKLAGMARPLWERCDPMPLKRAIENRYAGGPRRERQLVQDLYTTYYVGALIAAGEVVTPESVMKAQLEDRHSGNGALYWGLAALIHIQWERWDQALQAQVQAMANYDDCPLRRDVRREVQRLLCVTGYALKIHSSTLEGLEDDLSALADSAVNRFQRVEARLLLGRYHLTVGNTQAARDHLEFALAQGGETYVGLLADDLLRELEGREPSPERQWRRAMLRVEEETRRMADTCDPWPLLAALEAVQACQIPAPARTGLRMLEATALVNLGREEEAEALLDQVPDQEQGDYRMQKLQLRAILCNRRGRTEEAEELAGKMEELMVQAGRDNGRREVFCLRCTARLKRGEAGGLEEGLRRYITCGGPLLSQVGDHLLLGRYCLAVGRIEEAGEHLTFAAERGGPMYVGKEAAQLLRTLRQSPRDGKN